MENQNQLLAQIKKRSIKSILILSGRTIIMQLVSLVGYFFITLFLERPEFGLFILVSAIIDILGYFSDIGLAAALVQKHEKPTLKEIRSTFTIQQILVLGIIIVLFLFSPLLKQIYHLNQYGMLLLYAFAISFFLSSLKTIPSVLLERKLEFTKVVIPQFVEAISFNIIVVLLAWKGFGIKSFIAAVLVRSLLGTITLYLIAPWKIGLYFSLKVLKKLLQFGVPYQLNTLLAVVKDKVMILILGIIIGSDGIALVGWAEKWASIPLRYFLDNTVKVAFPAFSRLQHHTEKLKRAIEASLYFLCITIFPALAGISVIANSIIELVPRLNKWQPALIALYLYTFAAAWGTISTLLTNALTAIGKIKIVFKLMVMWTILTWLFVPIFSWKFGYLGVALATAIISFSSLVPLIIIKRYINLNLSGNIIPPLVACFIMIIVVMNVKRYLPVNYGGLFLQIMLGILTYGLSIMLINKNKLLKEIKILSSYVKK